MSILDIVGIEEAAGVEATDAALAAQVLAPDLADLAEVNTVADVEATFGRMQDRIRTARDDGQLSDMAANAADDLIAGTQVALRNGAIDTAEVPGFWRWLPEKLQRTATLPGVSLDSRVEFLALAYAAEVGHAPGKPKPAKPAGPTPGQRAVSAAARGIHARAVPGGGLDKAQAAAVSRAIGVAYSDMLRAQAFLIDQFFGPITAGELPEALADLFRADSILARQVGRLANEVAGKAPAHVVGHLHGAQEALHGLEQEVHLQAEQLAEVKPSTLHTHVQNNSDQLVHLTSRVGHISGSVIPALAAGLTVTDRNLGNLNALTEGISSGHLQHDLNTLTAEVRTKVEPSLQTLEDCCAENAGVTGPIREGGATPSMLRQLGGLLGKAFAIGWVVTLAETLLTIVDARASVAGVVADIPTIADWAAQAAGAIESDLSWMGAIGG